MMYAKHFSLPLVVIVFALLYSVAQAQTPRLSTINITAEADKLHVAAQGDVSEVSLKVANKAGDVVFESGAISGNMLDWNMKDAQGERVSPGTYLATVTFRNAAGKLRKMVEQVTVAKGEEQTDAQAVKAAPSAPEAAQATVVTSGSILTNRIPLFDSASSIAMATMVEDAGNIGLSIVPRAGWRLDVLGGTLFRPGGSGGGEIAFGTPSGETGISITGTASNANRADLRSDKQTFKLLAGLGKGAMPSTNGIAISTAGNIGIGTAPVTSARLTINGDISANATLASAGVRGTAVTNAAGLYGKSSRGAGALGQSNASSIEGLGVAGKNTAGGWAMYAAGNTGQNRDSSGWVKAMVYISVDRRIIRCFNSQLPDGGASLPPNGNTGCGFKMETPDIRIDFGFKISDRFVTVAIEKIGSANMAVNFQFLTQYSDRLLAIEPAITNAGLYADAPVMVIVY